MFEHLKELSTQGKRHGGLHAAAGKLGATMDKVRTFLFDKGLLGSGAPSADVIGIEMPDGSVLGDKGNVKFRFTTTYMDAAAKGAL